METATTLSQILRALNIGAADWDYIIVGDGSGTEWTNECGWGSVLIEKSTFERQVFYGSANHGTNNVAEVLAIMMPLMYLSNQKKGVRRDGAKVVVLSDSTYVVEGLRHTSPVWVSKLDRNRELWMAIHMSRRRGLTIYPHHIPRDTIDLNKLGHDLANLARKAQIGLLDNLSWDPQQTNP